MKKKKKNLRQWKLSKQSWYLSSVCDPTTAGFMIGSFIWIATSILYIATSILTSILQYKTKAIN